MNDKAVELLDQWNAGLLEPLRKTLIYAKENVEYYGHCIDEVKGETIYDLLQCLPVLTKDKAIQYLPALRRDKIHQAGRISTGTLRQGRRFMDVQHIEAESKAIDCYFQFDHSWSHAYRYNEYWNPEDHSLQAVTPSIVSIVNTHYEIPKPSLSSDRMSLLWTSHANSIEMIFTTFLALGEIDYVEVEPYTLIKMTLMLIERGFDFSKVKIRHFLLQGFVTSRWKKWLFDQWGARLDQVFSLSEMRPKAFLCSGVAGLYYRFDSIPVVTEVLDTVTLEPVTQGAGLLAMTPLYPFVQQQFLLRYLTQDVVTIVPDEDQGTLGFQWCGRDRDVIYLDEKQRSTSVIGYAELLECLEPYYELARSQDDFETLGLIAPNTVGWPLCKMECRHEAEKTVLIVHLILNFNPQVFPEKTEMLCKHIRLDLIEHNSYLTQQVPLGKVDVELIPYPPEQRHYLENWSHQHFEQIVR